MQAANGMAGCAPGGCVPPPCVPIANKDGQFYVTDGIQSLEVVC